MMSVRWSMMAKCSGKLSMGLNDQVCGTKASEGRQMPWLCMDSRINVGLDSSCNLV